VISGGRSFWLSTLTLGSSYVGHIMPALFLTSFGLGLSFVVLTLTAVHGVADERAGVASALVNMAQQIGAALGLALFTTVAVSAAGGEGGAALAHGYSTAFLAGAGMLLIAAAIATLAVNARRQRSTIAH
jgi:hypothetical protein